MNDSGRLDGAGRGATRLNLSVHRTGYPAAAERVANAILATAQRLSLFPRRYPQIVPDIHQAAVPRLPYVIRYRIFSEKRRVVILAVRHMARRPDL